MRPDANLAKRLTKILCLRLVSWEQRIMMTTQSGSLKSYLRRLRKFVTSAPNLQILSILQMGQPNLTAIVSMLLRNNNDLQTTPWVTQRCFYSFQTFRRSTPSSVKIVFHGMGTVVDLCKRINTSLRHP